MHKKFEAAKVLTGVLRLHVKSIETAILLLLYARVKRSKKEMGI